MTEPARADRTDAVRPHLRAVTGAEPEPGLTIDDFWAHLPSHEYICVPTREPWPAISVNAHLPPVHEGTEQIKPAAWLDRHRAVNQQTWAPGLAEIIEDRLIDHGGWIEQPGCRVFNLYRPPRIELGNPDSAEPWIEHVHRVFDRDADHIINWFAHRLQRPGEKPNHALLLGGLQGVGKDSAFEPVKQSAGPWNVKEVSPTHLLGRFNDFVESVILRISEGRDLGDLNRYSFYEHLKAYTAAPPDVLRCDKKYVREYSVLNVCGVIITTNHKTDGIYLPADDRRHFVAWSERRKEDFPPSYWSNLHRWYQAGGFGHVAAYLHALDISSFDPKAPPPKTPAFWAIVDANRAPEDAELADVLDALGNPLATTIAELAGKAGESFASWLQDRRNARQVPHRLEAVGYVAIRNDSTSDGRWKVGGRNMVIYAQQDLSVRDQIAAARALTEAAR